MNTSLCLVQHVHTDFYCLYLFFFMMPQNDVISPKCTKCSCPLTWSLGGGRDEIKTVELVIETTPANIDWKPIDKSNPGDCLIFNIVFLQVLDQLLDKSIYDEFTEFYQYTPYFFRY